MSMEVIAFSIVLGGIAAGVGFLMLRDVIRSPRARVAMLSRLLAVLKSDWLYFIFALILIGLILPIVFRPREGHPNRTPTASVMNMLAKAMFMYADENGGHFPSGGATPTESLWMLYPKYVQDPRAFLNPNEGLHMPGNQPLTNDPKSRIAPEYLSATGFIYVEGHGDTDASSTILFERRSFKNARNVLIGAGTVEVVSEPDFQQRTTRKDAPTAETTPALKPAESK